MESMGPKEAGEQEGAAAGEVREVLRARAVPEAAAARVMEGVGTGGVQGVPKGWF